MSQETKKELKFGIMSVLFGIFGSLMGTIWYSAQLAKQVEHNSAQIQNLSGKIEKLTEVIIEAQKDKR
jgi:hypothetical protein